MTICPRLKLEQLMGGSHELSPLYGVVNSSKIAELGLGGQEELKCGRKKIHSRMRLCRERSGIATAGKNPK